MLIIGRVFSGFKQVGGTTDSAAAGFHRLLAASRAAITIHRAPPVTAGAGPAGMEGDIVHGSSENIDSATDAFADGLCVLVHSRPPGRASFSRLADAGGGACRARLRSWESGVRGSCRGGSTSFAGALVIPFLALCIFTALPLPCAVFAWKTADGETATAGECFAFCRRRGGRLFWILFRMSLLWLGSLLLLGLPLAWVLPKTSLAPLVGLV